MKLGFLREIVSLGVLLVVFSHSVHARKSKAGLFDQLESRARLAMSLALIVEPKDQEVCFSPDEPCELKLIKFIDSAKTTLDIAVFDFNLDQLAHHVLVKSKSIPVRIVVDRRQAKTDHTLVPMLIKAGAKVKFGRQKGIMHNKFVIVDGKKIETGSFNYTNGAAFKNSENQVYLSNSAVVQRFQKRFSKLWAEGKSK